MTFAIFDIRTNEQIAGPYTVRGSAVRSFRSRNLSVEKAYIGDLDWELREAGRANLINVEEFGLMALPSKYLHVSPQSTETELLVSYTENKIKGMRDLQASPRKIGRYLQEFYQNLTSQEIAEISAKITAKALALEVRFAKTVEEIRNTYTRSDHNSQSCMSHAVSHFASKPHHPVDAYAGPDLQIAYLCDQKGLTIARSLVWPEKKLYSRMYGAKADKLQAALRALGYKPGAPYGARLSKVPMENHNTSVDVYYACPYIDGDYRTVYDVGDYLVIGTNLNNPSAPSASTVADGYVRFRYYRSAVDGSRIHSGDIAYALDPQSGGEVYVSRKQLEQDCWVSPTGQWWVKTNQEKAWKTTEDGRSFPVRYIDYYMKKCLITGKLEESYKMIEVPGGFVMEEAYYQHYALCAKSRRMYKKTDMVFLEDVQLWVHKTIFRDHGVIVDGKHYVKILAPVKAN